MDSSTAKTNKQIIPIQYGQGSSIRNVTSQMLLEIVQEARISGEHVQVHTERVYSWN